MGDPSAVTYLLDTNIISNPPKLGNPALATWLDRHASTSRLSVIVAAEMRRGLALLDRKVQALREPKARMREQDRLDRKRDHYDWVMTLFRDRLEVMDLAVAERCAELSVDFPSLGDADKAIAATALVRGYSVATQNVKDFRKIGVPLVNPYDPATWPEELVDDPLLRLLAP